jgi:hypothetical protein
VSTASAYLTARAVSEAPLGLEELKNGFATFLWGSSRSIASLHARAARALAGIEPAKQADARDFPVAGSFVQYLFERQGIRRLRHFLSGAARMGVEAAARAYFGKPLAELEGDWKSMLQSFPR